MAGQVKTCIPELRQAFVDIASDIVFYVHLVPVREALLRALVKEWIKSYLTPEA